ncbi:DeoR/GlpR transcriptional regulator [Anaerobacillus alkaliphilus]|uniref:DeoR/GlpR transcriptional regulator n=1 Tax=Anaerobacillus alkaliphilus TaxID=1548597 RepID=A0A4V1LG98_9BACI|nr:DeoR/GlpR family DNA-binding transcription regulator [Anaerobacillus alkaliphilus]RXI99821.1 DeoR/GlpR transcriptional regulator [Anaerobacillus alkaliphilus]
MLTPERHRIILDLLANKEVVKLQEFVDATESSESTIRRDLSQLESEKKLKRVHGGASLLQQKGEELSVLEKSTKNVEEKELIARYAASLIRDNDCIYLDAGTTAFLMIPHIQANKVKVVTNGLTHLESLLEHDIETYITGGLIKPKTRALIGRGAIEGIEQYRFDKCFIGVNGIHNEFGYTTPDPEEATVKKRVMNLSQQCFILADHSKFNEITFSKIADLQHATILTNENEEDILKDYLTKTTIKVVTT